MKLPRIGLIGIGTMGKCILQALLQDQYPLTVFDVSEVARTYAAELGAAVAAYPGDVAKEASIIIISLPGPQQLEEVIFGDRGLVQNLTADHIVIDSSTVAPTTSQVNSQRLAAYGARYLDAPILGRPSAVGKWLLPVGGDEDALKQAMPALLTFAGKVLHVGPSGSGNALKLLNQLMFSVINAISSEVFAIAEASGLDTQVFYETIAGSSAATVSGLFKEVGRCIVDDCFDQPTFTMNLLHKDTQLALEMARSVHAPSLIGGFIQLLNTQALESCLGPLDTSSLVQVFRNQIGRDLAK